MGKGKPHAVEKGIIGYNCGVTDFQLTSCIVGSLAIPPPPVFCHTDDMNQPYSNSKVAESHEDGRAWRQ
ncbi:histone demethylase JARID1 [Dendrobium catenatum]|uniref:Histone demethylase JARID1 n=1 Tax=Dendrobium catenatum TaxID=906689 RepID=A0A2I0X9Z7_9ASPA|nr:histone demethylase JARID1 [Dendrobium catenatum]